MRITTIYILVGFALFGCNNSIIKTEKVKDSLEQEFIYKNLQDKNLILKDLYGSRKFDAQGNIIWSAQQIDFPEIPVSYDNQYHSTIDTIMYFIDNKDDSCAVIILANYNIQMEENIEIQSGSHFDPVSLGIALFIKEKEGWELFKIKKHLTELGYGGTYRTGGTDQGMISLKKFGNKWSCLSFKQGIGGNTGEFWGYERIYSIERDLPKNEISKNNLDEMEINEYEIFTQILSYNYHHNYYHPDLENQNSTDITLKTITKSNGVYDVQMVINEENYNIETNKINSRRKSIREFVFSPMLNVYIEKNNPNRK